MTRDPAVLRAASFLTILFLGFVDALATLELIQRGALEWNPLMRYSIGIGENFFIFHKMLLTFFCSVILVLAASRYRLAAFGLHTLAVIHILLACLHAVLLFIVPSPLL